MLFWSMFSFGQEFTDGGIRYQVTSATAPTTVQVIAPPTSDPEYTGVVTIPATASDGTTTYSVTAIDNYAFAYSLNLTSVDIPNSVTSIGESAFFKCSSLTSVNIPSTVTTIGIKAFFDCTSLTSITIPNSVTSIGDEVFYKCTSLNSVTIPNSVTTIGTQAFFDCTGLTSVTIPNSVTTIGNSAFFGCANLPSVTIPNSVSSIGDSAFKNCTGLTSVTVEWTTPLTIANTVFGNITLANVTLHIPAGTYSTYDAAPVWTDFNIDNTLGITDVQKEATAIQVYPNPTTNFITLKNSEGINQVKVFSLEGKLLKTEKVNSKNATLDLSYLPKGIYLLQTNRGSIKVVKQ